MPHLGKFFFVTYIIQGSIILQIANLRMKKCVKILGLNTKVQQKSHLKHPVTGNHTNKIDASNDAYKHLINLRSRLKKNSDDYILFFEVPNLKKELLETCSKLKEIIYLIFVYLLH